MVPEYSSAVGTDAQQCGALAIISKKPYTGITIQNNRKADRKETWGDRYDTQVCVVPLARKVPRRDVTLIFPRRYDGATFNRYEKKRYIVAN